MEREFVPYQPSFDVKELGFDEPCFAYFAGNGEPMIMPQRGTFYVSKYESYRNTFLSYDGGKSVIPNEKDFEKDLIQNPDKYSRHKWGVTVSAPTFSQVFRFFREKYEMPSWLITRNGDRTLHLYCINPQGQYSIESEEYNSYEEAQLECLKKLIEIAKELVLIAK